MNAENALCDPDYTVETEDRVPETEPTQLTHASPLLEARRFKSMQDSRVRPRTSAVRERRSKGTRHRDRGKRATLPQLTDHNLLDLLQRLKVDDHARERFFEGLGEHPYTSLHSTFLQTVRKPWCTPLTIDLQLHVVDTLATNPGQRQTVLRVVNSDPQSNRQLRDLILRVNNDAIVGRSPTPASPITDAELHSFVRHLQNDLGMRQSFFHTLREREHLLLRMDLVKILNLRFNRPMDNLCEIRLLYILNTNPVQRTQLRERINRVPEKTADFRDLMHMYIPTAQQQPTESADSISDEQLRAFIWHLQTDAEDRAGFFNSFTQASHIRLENCFIRVQGMGWFRAVSNTALQLPNLAEVGASARKRVELLHAVNESRDSKGALKRLMEEFGPRKDRR